MPANSDADRDDVKKMIKYILSLAEGDDVNKMAPEGTITPNTDSKGKVLIVTASYTDKGAEGSQPLTTTTKTVLRNGN